MRVFYSGALSVSLLCASFSASAGVCDQDVDTVYEYYGSEYVRFLSAIERRDRVGVIQEQIVLVDDKRKDFYEACVFGAILEGVDYPGEYDDVYLLYSNIASFLRVLRWGSDDGSYSKLLDGYLDYVARGVSG